MDRLALAAAGAEGVDDGDQLVQVGVDGQQPVGPAAEPTRRLRRHRRAHQPGRHVRAGPDLGVRAGHQAAMRHGFAGQQPAHDLGALAQTGVAGRLVGPVLAGDVLVEELAAAERDPGEAAGKHLPEGADRLGQDRRVVAPAAGHADGAEGEPRSARQGGAEPGPGEAGLPLRLRPGMRVIRGKSAIEPGGFGLLDEAQQVRRRELFLRSMIREVCHRIERWAGPPICHRACPS